ncbi:MAG TPA: MlaD family protein [Thermoleophilaceae bacterium]|nr:MlaD family protein [Thermoleophilaceae bacterium]
MTRRPSASIVASPVLVGAVTVLVAIVAVFLAYNANQGLPFVPTYDVKVELPSGSNLVAGNEVRIGGFRVGVVDDITTATRDTADRENDAIAIVSMKLDAVVDPLPEDTTVFVRQRSALGLKYVELTPGASEAGLDAGETLPLEQASEPVEFDDVFSTFDEPTRAGSRVALEGFGDALAGRGASLNRAIEAFRPLFVHLQPVMRNLSAPETELDEFFRQLGATARQVAPVADVQAQLFVNMADTFDAFSRDPAALQATIEKAAPTMEVAIESFRVQRPFLSEFATLSRELRPAAQELPRSLPDLNDALVAGQPVLRRSVDLNERTAEVFESLDDLAAEPDTLLALANVTDAVTVTRPLIQFVAPYQTVCNYWNTYWGPLGEHQSAETAFGTVEQVILKEAPNRTQDDLWSSSDNDRPMDIPADLDPDTATDPTGAPLVSLHGQPYSVAVDAQGNADCQVGQWGYLEGPLIPSYGRYPADLSAGNPAGDGTFLGGGSHLVLDRDIPGNRGPTWVNRETKELGPRSIKDVDRWHP